MTTPLRSSRRISRDPTPNSATRPTPTPTGLTRPRSNSRTGIPMTASRAAANRQASTQPTYDFLAGGGGGDADNTLKPSTSRMSLRQSVAVKADLGNEELRTQLKTLQYEVERLKQDKEVTRLRHEKEVRDAQTQAEADAKKAHASASSSHAAASKYEALAKELNDLKDASTNQHHDSEKKLRIARDDAETATEELEEARSALASMEREHAHTLRGIEDKHALLHRTVKELEEDGRGKTAELSRLQERLQERERATGDLESAVLQLKTQAGDAAELSTIKTQLSDQVNHIRRLEKANHDQLTELRNLRESHRAVGIVEEEKRGLQRKVQRMEELEHELGEARFQRQMLEEERKAWTAHLQGEAADDAAPEFDSPEAISRALTEERTQRLTLEERLGAVQPSLAEKEELINGLDQENQRLKTDLAALQSNVSATNTSTGSKARATVRLERQKNLLTKEVEYLRAQLQTFDHEEDTTQDLALDAAGSTTTAAAKMDEQARRRIDELESLVNQYRSDLATAHAELSSAQTEASNATSDPQELKTPASKKRSLDDTEERENEQLGTLSRKNRKLQDTLVAAEQRSAMLARELDASKTQVASLQELARVRVLSLRENPADAFERVKLSQIRTLRTENAGLHALLERQHSSAPRGAVPGSQRRRANSNEGADDDNEDVVPRASLDAKEQELDEMRAQIAERDKRMLRLKQSWAAKSLEMRQGIASILGWKIEFAPNGRWKLSSIFSTQGGGDDEDEDEEVDKDYLMFDGEKGTIHVSGGPNGEFAREIRTHQKFWIEGRKEIPGFMAAVTLDFCDRATRAMRV